MRRSGGVKHPGGCADESDMAANEAHDAHEKDGLSTRMRDLIRLATVEERRNPKNRKGSGPEGELRRRTDQVSDEKQAS